MDRLGVWILQTRYRYFCALALRVLGQRASPHDAQDAVSEFFPKRFFRVIAGYDPAKTTNLRAYLITAFINHCHDFRDRFIGQRGEREQGMVHADPDTGEEFEIELIDESPQSRPEEVALAQERTQILYDCIKKLPPRERELVCRHHLFGDRVEGVARALGMTGVNGRVTLHRALRDLRQCLRAFGIFPTAQEAPQ